MRFCLSAVVILSSVAPSPPFSVATRDDVDEAIAVVGAGAADAELLDALKILAASRDPQALNAAEPVAELCAHTSADVRTQAVTALGLILAGNEQPCHAAIVRAMRDDDVSVRSQAMDTLSLFCDRLPPEAGPALLERARSRDADTRAQAVIMLGYCPGDRDRHRAVMFQALYDADIMVRNNAVAGLFVSKCELREVLAHSLLILDTPFPDSASEEETARYKMCAFAQAHRMKELGETQPTDLIPELIELLNDDSEIVRGAAARNLGALWRENEACRPLLREHRARSAVNALVEDASPSVRRNVAYALGEMPAD